MSGLEMCTYKFRMRLVFITRVSLSCVESQEKSQGGIQSSSAAEKVTGWLASKIRLKYIEGHGQPFYSLGPGRI
jgi:hypothetical protein